MSVFKAPDAQFHTVLFFPVCFRSCCDTRVGYRKTHGASRACLCLYTEIAFQAFLEDCPDRSRPPPCMPDDYDPDWSVSRWNDAARSIPSGLLSADAAPDLRGSHVGARRRAPSSGQSPGPVGQLLQRLSLRHHSMPLLPRVVSLRCFRLQQDLM